MDLIESIKKDKAYMKCKLVVKTWEKKFKAEHLRTPSKFDIKEAPAKIKYAYKKYFQLKSNALENSLSICDFEEESVIEPASPFHFESTTLEALSPPLEQSLPDLPSGQELTKLLAKPSNIDISETLHPFTDNLSKKLFQNCKFSLRNPRKLSLPKRQSTSEESNSIINKTDSQREQQNGAVIKEHSLYEQGTGIIENKDCQNKLQLGYLTKNDDLPAEQPIQTLNKEDYLEKHQIGTLDKETQKEKSVSSLSEKQHIDRKYFIQFNKNLSNSDEKIETTTIDPLKGPSVRQLDAAWIQRATGLETQAIGHDVSNKFGLSNISLPNVETMTCDYVENSESEGEDIDKLKPALKKRKICNYSQYAMKNESQKEIEDTALNTKQKKRKGKKSTISSNENQINKKKASPKAMDLHLDQGPPDIKEYLPFGLEEVAPRHSKVTNILKTIGPITNSTDSFKVVTVTHAAEKLDNKIKNGTLNENFVKINIEKKVFVRGKKSMNYSKYKKQEWKNKKALHSSMEFPSSGKIACFKCGEDGHMARYCIAHRGERLLPLEDCDDTEIPTLEDMRNLISQESNQNLTLNDALVESFYKPSQIPESFVKLLGEPSSSTNIKPVYTNLHTVSSEDIEEALKMFGHTSFRTGQEHAIKRILCGMSTLLILSTGGGKSLCYQLPAYLYSRNYKCITLVISPLVSLMEDQVLNMPEFLKAGCLHTNQPPTQRQKIVQCLKNGEINILLISPEALISGDTSNGFTGLFKSLPPVAFACIDEAHCVSHWSHNFRPSYLTICRVLREKLNVKCILGLTATASQPTILSIIDHIEIPDSVNGVITNPALPDNLQLSVSLEKDKDRALVSFLTSQHISNFNSIIIYCIRRDECERIAAILRSCLQEVGKNSLETQNRKRKRMSFTAEAYHAGMSAAQRKKIQKNFMDGTLRIIVATVAFGMGINKPDIRCIIHYNMPSSFESYVQEVGRAGRDNMPAVCHVFINNSNSDANELLRHIYSNYIDRSSIRKLLQKVFIACECTQVSSSISSVLCQCKGHEVGIPVEATVEELDLPSENIATLLCYVELHPKKYIKVLNNAYIMCKISSYGGPKKILEAAKTCQPLAMAYLMESKRDTDIVGKSILEFNVIEVAAAIGWESGMTKYHLKNLEWTSDKGISKRSYLKVEFHTLGFRIKARGDLSSSELDEILDDLHETVVFQEKVRLYQLEECKKAFGTLGTYSIERNNFAELSLLEQSNELKNTIRNYFQRTKSLPDNVILEQRPVDADRIANDVRALITSYKDCTFTGRNVAKIFQGISSPNFPALVWGRCKFWRSHIHEDFNELIRIATQQIIQLRK